MMTTMAQAQSLEAGFSGQIVKVINEKEAEVRINSLSQNQFQLLPGEIIRVNFYPSEAKSELTTESLLSGKLYYNQAQVNQDLIDWYMVKDYQVSPPPRLSNRARQLLALVLGLVAVGSVLATEKIRQNRKKLL